MIRLASIKRKAIKRVAGIINWAIFNRIMRQKLIINHNNINKKNGKLVCILIN